MKNEKFHYTSVEGMAAILGDRTLRLTRSEFLNDPADGKVLFTIVKQYIDSKRMDIDSRLATPDLKLIYQNAPVDYYMEFLQKHIHLYVLSLTENNDEMSMWNYYGSGGMQLCIDVDELVQDISSKLPTDNYYIAVAPVKYISDGDTVSTIVFEAFRNFQLNKKGRSNIFFENSHKRGKNGALHPLYQTTELSGFVDTYIKGYIESLKYLHETKKTISCSSGAEEVFRAVFENTNELNNYYEFKKDLTLYLIVLSALLKNDTYRYENEYRVVIFENALAQSENVKYFVQSLQGQKYMRPFIEMREVSLDCIKGVTLSPLTKNLPIDGGLYTEVIGEFVGKKTGKSTAVTCSKHKIRW